MNKEFLKKIFYQSLTGFLSLALAILLFFAILKLDELASGFRWLADILAPFIYGGTMAYLLKTPCNFLDRHIEAILPKKLKGLANVLSVVIVLLLSGLAIYLLLSMIIPEVYSSIQTLVDAIPPKVEQFAQWVQNQLEGNEVLQNYAETAFSSIETWLENWVKNDMLATLKELMSGTMTAVGDVMGGAMAAVSSVVTVLKNIVLGVIICIYLLLDRKRFARHGKALVYSLLKTERADKVIDEFSFIDKTFVGFFGGKILDSAIVGLLCYIFCAIMSVAAGFQNAVLISVIIGVTNVIPYFGPFIGAIPSALLILISSPRNCIIFLIFIVILQQFDGNILGPKLLSDSVGLSGFWVLFSITLFSGLFGFVGILVGVPVFAVIYDLMKRGILLGLEKHGKMEVLRDRPPE